MAFIKQYVKLDCESVVIIIISIIFACPSASGNSSNRKFLYQYYKIYFHQFDLKIYTTFTSHNFNSHNLCDRSQIQISIFREVLNTNPIRTQQKGVISFPEWCQGPARVTIDAIVNGWLDFSYKMCRVWTSLKMRSHIYLV